MLRKVTKTNLSRETQVMRPSRCALASWLLTIPFFGFPTAGDAAGFAAITAEQKALTSVPGYPNAAAVVLFEKGEFRMLDPSRDEQSSVLSVEVRLKILSEQGKERFGNTEVYHSPFVRLRGLKGRTVLPDGREIPVGEDATFERKASRSQRLKATTITFPALEVGAIVDYRYEVRFDTLYYLDPWRFQQTIPVLLSEITYTIPKQMGARAWSRDPLQVGIQHESSTTALGNRLRVWATDVPPLLDEPDSFPDEDLSALFMMIPVKWAGATPLLDSWETTCELVENANYNDARRNVSAAKRQARELASGAKTAREKALLAYRFVRDSIETERLSGVLLGDKDSPDKTLADRRGDYAAKAFLLATMLDGLDVGARLVWAAARSGGRIDPAVPSYSWFDRVLVRVELDGQATYLDPSEPGLAFGQLDADYEGTTALLYDRRKPEVTTLPATTVAASAKELGLELALAEDGRLSGQGTLTFRGHQAAQRIEAKDSAEGLTQRWTDWLTERFKGFTPSEVRAEQAVDEQRLTVTFKLTQVAEDVLGDEASLNPNQPWGPGRRTLALPPDRRSLPVLFAYPDVEQLSLSLSWPEGWELDGNPPNRAVQNGVGSFRTTWDVAPAERRLRYERRFEIAKTQLLAREDYAAAWAIHTTAGKNDAQSLLLVRR
jgi:hypothetical protein